MNTVNLKDYGWNDTLERGLSQVLAHKDDTMLIGRIILDYGQKLKVMTNECEKTLQRPPQSDLQLAVGDWVLGKKDSYDSDIVHFICVLDRKTKFSRLAAGIEVKEQIVATNIDIVFIVQSLNNDFNLRRLERYLIATWESGAKPVVVLTKSDLCEDFHKKVAMIHDLAMGVEVHAISTHSGFGLEAIMAYFKPGLTVALLGSSGVGKSTLVNALLGEARLKTQDIRWDDSKGRHTTTHRELVLLPSGGMVLDTPGMRTLALWDAEEGMTHYFGDIESLLRECRYADCTHTKEPGCAVQKALSSGSLSQPLWESWGKLQKEQKRLSVKLKQKERALDKYQQKYKQKKESKSHVIRRALEE